MSRHVALTHLTSRGEIHRASKTFQSTIDFGPPSGSGTVCHRRQDTQITFLIVKSNKSQSRETSRTRRCLTLAGST
jgi:hypothetical protein